MPLSVSGSDCALGLTNLDSICANADAYYQWGFDSCLAPSLKRKLRRLENACQKANELLAQN